MKPKNISHWRALWALPPVALGVVVLLWLSSTKPPPVKVERLETTSSVRVIEIPRVNLVPTAEGYGPVQPGRVWTAVTQVAGRIVEIHPRLREGEILSQGVVLFRIDPVDYELNLALAKAELTELDVQEENARASLAIEHNSLELAQRELKRIKKLAHEGTASQSDADSAERTMLSMRTAVQNIQNSLALIPAQRERLQVKMAQAERDLVHTKVTAPFNLRVANLQIEADQYVTKGQSLFEGDGVDRAEIVAQLAISSLRRLFIGRDIPIGSLGRLNENLPEFVGFQPRVRMDMGKHVAEWEAEFVRFSDHIDPDTRTIGVVVAVDRPWDKVKPGYRPPLSKGMFVQVELRGQIQPDRVVVPRSAVRNDSVYLVDDENRLRRQPVEVLFSQARISVIKTGVEAGQRLVVSDLVPAVNGMLLRPEVDDDLTAELLAAARAGS